MDAMEERIRLNMNDIREQLQKLQKLVESKKKHNIKCCCIKLKHVYPCISMFSPDDFVQFYLCKGYEVITDLGFQRHLIQCREQGEQWAVEMHQHQTKILQACKKIQTQIFHVRETHTTDHGPGSARTQWRAPSPPSRCSQAPPSAP